VAVKGVEGMNPRERVEEALRLRQPDRVPVHPHISRWAAKLTGSTVQDYYLKPEVMVQSQKTAWRLLGHEVVYIGSDITVEAQALGCQSSFPPQGPPMVVKPVLEDAARLPSLKPPKPRENRRMSLVLEALRRAEEEFRKSELMICGDVVGPLTLAGYLRGAENLVRDVARSSSHLPALLELATETIVSYAEEQVESGAHMVLINDPMASGSFVSPEHYRLYAAPYQRRIASCLRELGAYTMLHICGNTSERLGLMAETGIHALSLDAKVDLQFAKETVGKKVCIAGNLDPVRVLMEGKPEDVKREAAGAIEKAGGGGGFILMPGCGVPEPVPAENLKAMMDAVRAHGLYR
jgi:uroporphyrinogen decarboxylase